MPRLKAALAAARAVEPTRETVLCQRPPGAEALDGIAQQDQEAGIGRGLSQQGRRPHVEHVARRPLPADVTGRAREEGVIGGRCLHSSRPVSQSASKKWTSLGVVAGRLTRGWALMRLSHQVVPERAVPTPT